MTESRSVEATVLPSPGLSLRKNFSWTALGNVVYAACQWGIIAVLAKLSDAEAVGVFALGLAITAPIALFFQLQLRGVQATDAKATYDFPEYLTLRVVTTVAALAVSVAVMFVSHLSGPVFVVVGLIALAKAIDSISDVFYGAFQQREQMDLIAKAVMSNGVLSIGLMALGVWATGRLWIGVLGFLLGSLVPLVVYVIPSQRRYLIARGGSAKWFCWDRERTFALGRLAFPLGIVMLLVSLTSNVPRYVIEHRLGTADLGIFAALGYLIVAGATVVGALGQAASPRLAALYAAGRYRQFRRMVLRLMMLGLALGFAGFIVAGLAGKQLLEAMYSPEYAGYSHVLLVLTIAASLNFAASFAGYGMTAARKFTIQTPIFAVVLIVSIAMSLLLIPSFGLSGAAYGLVATGAVQLFCSMVVILRATAVMEETAV